ncbi:MAG: CBS domain-containing protein [Ktedonobacterales bacterium]
MPGSFRLFKVAGISIEVNISWLIILVLLASSLALTWFPSAVPRQSLVVYWVLGLIAALLLFGSVLVHELAHSLVAKARGLPVKSITLFIFGGVSDIEREPQSPGVEFQMAFVGPLTSLIIGSVSLLAGLAIGKNSPLVAATLDYLGLANLLLGGCNLIPGFPLDGGRVLRSIIWKATGSLRTATRWAAYVGQGVAYLLILFGIWLFFTGDIIGGLWSGFIGWFLLQAAQAENTQVMLESVFKGVTVAQLMSPAPITVPSNRTIQQLVDEYLLPHAVRSVPVVRDYQLVGLITLADVRRVPRERWPQAFVSEAMIPVERLAVAHPEESLNEVLPRMAAPDVNQLPVVEDGRLVGILSRDAILRYIEIRRGLGLDQTGREQQAPSQPRTPVGLPA